MKIVSIYHYIKKYGSTLILFNRVESLIVIREYGKARRKTVDNAARKALSFLRGSCRYMTRNVRIVFFVVLATVFVEISHMQYGNVPAIGAFQLTITNKRFKQKLNQG